MRVNTEGTDHFIREDLRHMITADTVHARDAYVEYLARATHLVGNNDDSQFDWQVLFDFTDHMNDYDQVPDRRQLVAKAASRTTLDGIRLHGDGGSFITVSAHSGVPLAAGHVHSPEVPAHYGPPDLYILRKLGEAAFVEARLHQGADWGKGYNQLRTTSRQLKIIGKDASPHIGMASLHELPYTADTAGSDRNVLAITATSGRILTAQARRHIVTNYPAVAARMVGEQPHPDDLAGLLDTLSGTVANRTAIYGVSPQTTVVELPDPHHPENKLVDWN